MHDDDSSATPSPGTSEKLADAPFRVGDWLVEPSLNRISSGETTRSLEPRVMDVLRCLASKPGQVVNRRELLDQVWQAEYVATNSLTHVIAELRAALGDRAREPRYIQTIPKRGYRLVARVAEIPPASPTGVDTAAHETEVQTPAPPQRSLRFWYAAAITLLAVAAVVTMASDKLRRPAAATEPTLPRLVVLPFETLGASGDPAFAAGLCEEITARLAALHGLQVISRTSAVNYPRGGRTVAEIGSDLEVGYVLEGSVRWSPDPPGAARLRITPQLIRVRDDAHLWSAQYDRDLEDFFAVQSEIATQVVQHLDLAVQGEDEEILRRPPAAELPAYQEYLLARSALMSADGQNLRSAVAACDRALAQAPDFAQAWALKALAHAYVVHFDCGIDCDEHAHAAADALARAGELDPDLPELPYTRGKLAYFIEHELDLASEAFQEAILRRPNDSESHAGLAFVLRRLGRWPESVEALDRAIELDPLNAGFLWNQGVSLMYLHRHGEADALFDRAITAAPGLRTPYFRKVQNLRLADGGTARAAAALARVPGPHDASWIWHHHANLYFDRRFDEALELLDNPALADDPTRREYARCDALMMLGRSQEAAVACLGAIELVQQHRHEIPEHVALMYMALAHANLGHEERARTLIDQALVLANDLPDAPTWAMLAEDKALVLIRTGALDEAAELVAELTSGPCLLTRGMLANGPAWAALRQERSDS